MPRQKADFKQGKTTLWLLEQIEAFLTLNEMDNDGNALGWLISKDASVVQRLRDGGDITISKMDDIIAFLQNPVPVYTTSPRQGAIIKKALTPLTIQPRSIL